ncbi:DeoR family transcriptional regulator [Sinobaca qinghaiensis]|uniref:DeoR family transcriptional regulator n=1 Tax=Sinobaca qinghaiensis TaxID=342944 RepID=A0A419V962_9BACL|nr:DeoR/GlpR family DNA-binding transcription regulator [Sinobaca qinghaiensis]RKD76459.1 DeoR family transcriptional regulator [Sinobaca qinghaiensis]
MYQEERLIAIIDYLEKHERVSAAVICELFDVSKDTARRDLVRLEEEKRIIRTRGGAILPSRHDQVGDYQQRLQTVSTEKKKIGRTAASLVYDEDKLILDASTTVQACAEYISDQSCTVITNSTHQAAILSSKPNVRIHILGGELHKEQQFLHGESVTDKLSEYFTDTAFLGVVGISEHGLTIAHEEDGMVKRRMIKQAKRRIALADHSKIGVTSFYKFADLSEMDVLITDRPPSPSFQKLLSQHGVELLVSEERTNNQ